MLSLDSAETCPFVVDLRAILDEAARPGALDHSALRQRLWNLQGRAVAAGADDLSLGAIESVIQIFASARTAARSTAAAR